MTEVKIFAIYSQFLGECTANFKDSNSLVYQPMCESSIRQAAVRDVMKSTDVCLSTLKHTSHSFRAPGNSI